uniref:NAD(P)H-quinone oxidoreductase subunit 2, chloroplastic n=1 Tax=Prasinococcus sp. CCMP1194 TaxID=110672 RepID=A0A088CI50_9VIRI|nr:subunit 2 of NADH-plastoquinone oxidoreductase [Prasinococcus sp. CCMP1194]
MNTFLFSPLVELSPVFPEIGFLVSLIGILFLEFFSTRVNTNLIFSFVLISFIWAFGITIFSMVHINETFFSETAIFFNAFHETGTSLLFRFLVLVSSFFCFFLSFGYLKKRDFVLVEFSVLFLFFVLSSLILCGAKNLLLVFLALEGVSFSSSLLIGLFKQDFRANEASLKYFFMGGLSSALLVYSFSFMYGLSNGSLDMDDLSFIFSFIPTSVEGNNAFLGSFPFLCLFFGLAFKLSLVPFHYWTPDVFEGSPAPILGLLSVPSKVAYTAFLFTIFQTVFFGSVPWKSILQFSLILNLVIGTFVSLNQMTLKRFLGYSSISQGGFLLMGLLLFDSKGLENFFVYFFVYAISTLGILSCITYFGMKTGKDTLKGFSEIGEKDPLLAVLLSFFLLSLCGIPPFAGFFAKLYLFVSTWNADLKFLVFIGFLCTIISLYFYLRIIKTMLVDKKVENTEDFNYSPLAFSKVLNSPLEFNIFFCSILNILGGIFFPLWVPVLTNFLGFV